MRHFIPLGSIVLLTPIPRDLVRSVAVAVGILITESDQNLFQFGKRGGHSQTKIVKPILADPHGTVDRTVVCGAIIGDQAVNVTVRIGQEGAPAINLGFVSRIDVGAVFLNQILRRHKKAGVLQDHGIIDQAQKYVGQLASQHGGNLFGGIAFDDGNPLNVNACHFFCISDGILGVEILNNVGIMLRYRNRDGYRFGCQRIGYFRDCGAHGEHQHQCQEQGDEFLHLVLHLSFFLTEGSHLLLDSSDIIPSQSRSSRPAQSTFAGRDTHT